MKRYAIYFTPSPDTPLWHFGCAILGHDSIGGHAVPHPAHSLLDELDWQRLTAEPRRYGFHATLKAPFTLADGKTEDELLARARDVAASLEPFFLGHMMVSEMGNFVALRPTGDASRINEVSAICVEDLDAFRAALPDSDRQRRMSSRLTDRQIRNLDLWGYPHVFSDFRFHMTLTGPLDSGQRAGVVEALAELYAPVDTPVAIDAITVLSQSTAKSRFSLVRRIPLTGNQTITLS